MTDCMYGEKFSVSQQWLVSWLANMLANVSFYVLLWQLTLAGKLTLVVDAVQKVHNPLRYENIIIELSDIISPLSHFKFVSI